MRTSDLVRRRFRVGLVVLVALVAGSVGIFMVGSRATLFTRKVDYVIHFGSAAGLTTGNAVHLSGVTVGNVTEVRLSETPGDTSVSVVISVDRRVTSRVRRDTRASINTIGLLGDKYIELEGGNAGEAEIAPGGDILAAHEGGLEKLLAGSEGLLGDLSGIAHSLKIILDRTEKGHGLVGQLTSDTREGNELGSNLNRALGQFAETLKKINSGQTLAGKILADEKYGRETSESLHRAVDSAASLFEKVSRGLESKDSAIAGLLTDPDGRAKLFKLLDNLSEAGVSLASASKSLDSGEGLLPLLLHDEKFGKDFRDHLADFAKHADSISAKIDSGSGSAAKIINDPALFDAASDILVGVNDSKLLRWLIRNRQKRGIKDRYGKDQPAEKPNKGTGE